jgi:hypothetical protein
MKKATKAAGKKPAQKRQAAKKSSTKPKRKAQHPSELMQVVARLDAIADRLAEAAERLALLPTLGTQRSLPAPIEVPHAHADEHADDVEVAGATEEE